MAFVRLITASATAEASVFWAKAGVWASAATPEPMNAAAARRRRLIVMLSSRFSLRRGWTLSAPKSWPSGRAAIVLAVVVGRIPTVGARHVIAPVEQGEGEQHKQRPEGSHCRG